MALTYTPPLTSHFNCPDFHLPSVEGKIWDRDRTFLKKSTLVMFICNHCPYVKAIEERILALARDPEMAECQFLAICSNDPADYPEDHPTELLKRWREKKYPFPYLVDEAQTVARNFGAVCTPDFFLFNREQTLVYRGRLDDSWKDSSQVKRQDLREAILATLSGGEIPVAQVPSMGCSIKWKNHRD